MINTHQYFLSLRMYWMPNEWPSCINRGLPRCDSINSSFPSFHFVPGVVPMPNAYKINKNNEDRSDQLSKSPTKDEKRWKIAKNERFKMSMRFMMVQWVSMQIFSFTFFWAGNVINANNALYNWYAIYFIPNKFLIFEKLTDNSLKCIHLLCYLTSILCIV